MRENYDFEDLLYPAFVVVHGRGRPHPTIYNRITYYEHFEAKVCQSAEEASRLLKHYKGPDEHLQVFVVEHPKEVLEVTPFGLGCEYERPELEEGLAAK